MAGIDIGVERTRAGARPLPLTSDGADFVAIDFETANSSRSSACAVGVAIVRGGRLVDQGSTLINPRCEFSPYNIAVTGIRPQDTADAPLFSEIWDQLSALLADQIVVAHVATFDLGVLRQAVAGAGLEGIHARAFCSWKLARRAWPIYPSYGLSYLSQQLELSLDHHQAGSDAAASAGIVLSAMAHHGAASVDELFVELDLGMGTLDPSSFVGVDVAALSELRSKRGDQIADPDHPLYGRTVCFTGAMFSMTRREAAELVVAAGADFKNNMSANVTTLVIGDADFAQFTDGMRTGKMKKADALKADGFDIEIVAERDFLSMLLG